MKDVKKHTKKRKTGYIYQLEELVLLKYPLLKQFRFSVIFIKIPMAIISEIGGRKVILIFMWNHKEHWILKTTLRGNNIVEVP